MLEIIFRENRSRRAPVSKRGSLSNRPAAVRLVEAHSQTRDAFAAKRFLIGGARVKKRIRLGERDI